MSSNHTTVIGGLQGRSDRQQVHADIETNGQNNFINHFKTKIMNKNFLFIFGIVVFFLVLGGCQKDDAFDQAIDNTTSEQKYMLIEVSFDDDLKATNEMWQNLVDVSSGNIQQIEFTMLDGQGNESEVGGGQTFEDNEKITISQIKEEIFFEMTNTTYLDSEKLKASGLNSQNDLANLNQQRTTEQNYVKTYSDVKFTKMTLFVSESNYEKLLDMNGVDIDIIKKRL